MAEPSSSRITITLGRSGQVGLCASLSLFLPSIDFLLFFFEVLMLGNGETMLFYQFCMIFFCLIYGNLNLEM